MSISDTKLYHYTTCEGLLGILNSKALWATHYKCLNDSKEFIYASEIVYRDLYPIILEMTRSAAATMSRPEREVLEILGIEDQAKDITNITISIFYESMNGINTRPFILSFFQGNTVEVQNDGLLSLWRGYGSDGGYALEFDASSIEALMKTEYSKYAHAGWGFGPVVYEPDAQPDTTDYHKYRQRVVGDAMEIVKCHFEGRKYSPTDTDKSVKAFLNFIAMSKNAGFKEENEWRVWVQTYEENFGSDPESGASREMKKYQYRNRRGLFIPYVTLFDNIIPAIKKIIVGPHTEKELRAEMINAYCRNYGLQIKVSQSQIPYTS